MAKVQLCNVNVLDNPAAFYNPFRFEITFECIEDLKEDLEWQMIYVGSAESETYDQVLDTIYVGPVPEGKHMFIFQADPPDTKKIPVADALGVTVVLITSLYKGQEFVRVGYFINNEYAEQDLRENPPAQPQFNKVVRNILSTKPRVTRFKINWDDSDMAMQPVELDLGDSQDSVPAPASSAALAPPPPPSVFNDGSSQSYMEVIM